MDSRQAVEDLVAAAAMRPYQPRNGYPRVRQDRLGPRANKATTDHTVATAASSAYCNRQAARRKWLG